MNTEQERNDFEAWAKSHFGWTSIFQRYNPITELLSKNALKSGAYKSEAVSIAWESWQARASQIKPLPVESIRAAIYSLEEQKIMLGMFRSIPEEVNSATNGRAAIERHITALRALLGESK